MRNSAKLIVVLAFLYCLPIHAEETKTNQASLPVVSATELVTHYRKLAVETLPKDK